MIAILSHGDRQGVSCHVLCGGRHTHSSKVAYNILKNLVLQGSCRTFSSQINNFCKFLIWLFNLLRRCLLGQSFVQGQSTLSVGSVSPTATLFECPPDILHPIFKAKSQLVSPYVDNESYYSRLLITGFRHSNS